MVASMIYHIRPDVDVQIHADWQDERLSSSAAHDAKGAALSFTIEGPAEVLDLIEQANNPASSEHAHARLGVLAPPTLVTLAGAQREAAGVPLDAAFFAFAYPLPSLTGWYEEMVVQQGRCDPWLFFLFLGGYCYFDADRKLIRINALMLTPAAARLEMVGPYRPAADAIEELRRKERLQPVTLQPLVDAGFQSFGWVNPGETLSGNIHLLDDGMTLSGGGCFLYEMASGEHRLYNLVPQRDTHWSAFSSWLRMRAPCCVHQYDLHQFLF